MGLVSFLAAVQAEAPIQDAPAWDALSTLWILIAAILVFFMQAGFSVLEAGLVRAKNAGNVLMKNLLDFSSATLGYFVFGYAIMYGSEGLLFGTEGWFLAGVESPVDGLPVEVFWLFQAMFAGAAATIVAGAVAERMKFTSYLAYSFILSAFIYPIVGHWVWGGGWLAGLGFHDFAGSTVVHAVGGVTGLVAAWVLGPRFGKFNKDGSPNAIGGHSLPLASLGVFILWFGWYGFNAGSTLGMGEPDVVARIAINTTLAPAIGAVMGMITSWVRYGKPDLLLALNGALAGLVGITAGCAAVTPGAALWIGAIAGVLCVYGIAWIDAIRVDDPVGAVAVHGICGIWGTLAVGLWGRETFGATGDGLFMGGGFGALGIQMLGVIACLGFTAIAMWIVFTAIDSVLGLRVSHETELRGLDIDEHGIESYAGFQIFTTD
jgi:Amt family ammonium transporter